MGGNSSSANAPSLCLVNGTPVCHCKSWKMEDPGLYAIVTPSPDLRVTLRKLLSDHGSLTIQYITAAVFGLPFAPQIRQRLLDNQTEIGQALGAQPSVSAESGVEIGQLFTEHIAKAEKVVLAAIAVSQQKAGIVRGGRVVASGTASGTANSTASDALFMIPTRSAFCGHSVQQLLEQTTEEFYQQGDRLSIVLATVLSLPPETVIASFRVHTHQVVELAGLLIGRQQGAAFIKLQDAYISHLMKLADVIYDAIAVEQ